VAVAAILGVGYLFGVAGAVITLGAVYTAYGLQRRRRRNSRLTLGLPGYAASAQTQESEGLRQGASPLTNAYIDEVERRLVASGFKISRNVTLPNFTVDLVGARSEFKLSWLSVLSRFVFVASTRRLPAPVTGETVFQFSDESFDHALEFRGGFLPRASGSTVYSLAALVSDGPPSDDLKKRIQKRNGPRHWGASEFPVFVSLEERQLYYCKKVPVVGWALYRGQKKFVERQLAIT
jgi:hypothetical protein